MTYLMVIPAIYSQEAIDFRHAGLKTRAPSIQIPSRQGRQAQLFQVAVMIVPRVPDALLQASRL